MKSKQGGDGEGLALAKITSNLAIAADRTNGFTWTIYFRGFSARVANRPPLALFSLNFS
jgi:hypothetical protein